MVAAGGVVLVVDARGVPPGVLVPSAAEIPTPYGSVLDLTVAPFRPAEVRVFSSPVFSSPGAEDPERAVVLAALDSLSGREEGPVVLIRLGVVVDPVRLPAATPVSYSLWGGGSWQGVAVFASAGEACAARSAARGGAEDPAGGVSRVEIATPLEDVLSWRGLARRRVQGAVCRPGTTVLLSEDGRWVRKRSPDAPEKLLAELSWFLAAPRAVAGLVPPLGRFDTDPADPYYETEFVGPLSLSDLMLSGVLRPSGFEELLDRLFGAVEVLHGQASTSSSWASTAYASQREMYVAKTEDRLRALPRAEREEFCPGGRWAGSVAIPLDEVEVRIAQVVEHSGLLEPRRPVFLHGDLFPGNILLDRSGGLRLVDPRGSFGSSGLLGDPAYDLLKLGHSGLGRYDMTLAGVRRVGASGAVSEVAPEAATSVFDMLSDRVVVEWRRRTGLGEGALRLGVSLLLLSLPPLHVDAWARRTFVLDGLRMFAEAVDMLGLTS